MPKTSILLLLSFVSLLSAQSQNLNTPENFPDPKFRSIVAGLIGKPVDGIFTQENLDRITYLDVGRLELEDLSGIEFLTNLEYLICYFNHLKTLDLSRNKQLVEIQCGFNDLTRLNVSGLPRLKALSMNSDSRNQVAELDLAASTELERLLCAGNRIEYLDVSNCSKLLWFDCRGNRMKTLLVSPEAPLTHALCSQNELTSITSLAENQTIGVRGTLDITNNNLDCDDIQDVQVLLERIGPPQWGYLIEKTTSRGGFSNPIPAQLNNSSCRPESDSGRLYYLGSGFGYCPQNNLDSFDCLSGIEYWEITK